jgi:hypothetical protein
MKTIAQRLNVKKFPFEIKDDKGNIIYFENSDGYWYISQYNSTRNQTYSEDSDGIWWKAEYDSNGNEIYFENSCGTIIDNKQKEVEFTMDEIASKLGVDVKLLKIKK